MHNGNSQSVCQTESVLAPAAPPASAAGVARTRASCCRPLRPVCSSGRTVAGMRCAVGRSVDAVHLEIFVDRTRAASAGRHRPAPAAAARGHRAARGRRVRLPAAHARPDGHGLRRALAAARSSATSSRSGASGSRRGGCSRSRAACGPSATAVSGTGDPRRDAARGGTTRSCSRSAATSRRTRATSSRRASERRAARSALAARRARGGAACGGGGGSPAAADVAPAKEYKLDWQAPPASPSPGGHAASSPCVHARREGADAVPHGRGPAHGRARDRRARRPLGDRPQAPADPRQRPVRAARSICRAPAATTCSSTSTPRRDRCAEQLPAHARPAGRHGERQGAAARATRPSCTRAG